jgi:uncharacterized protein (TIGR03435 family)
MVTLPPPGQTSIQPKSDVTLLAFDVVSIRKNNGDDRPSGLYPDSYRAIELPLWRTISYAYFPTQFHKKEWIKDAPSWVFDENFDIVASLAAEDRAAWQALKNQTPTADNPELQAMFQKLLEDRCHLKVHRALAETEGYSLVATARLKLAPGRPDASTRAGTIMETDGGKVIYIDKEHSHGWEFHNVSMKTLLSFLSIFSGSPIQDETNLKETYDFTLEVSDESVESDTSPSNPLNDLMAVQLSLQGLGLKLNHSKIEINTIVVDHIERPSAN